MFIRNLFPTIMFDAEGGQGGGTDPKPEPKQLSEADVTSFLASKPEFLQNILGTDLGQKALQPKLDSHFSKSLETWKANNLDKIVNERVESLFPNETPQAKQMRELQQQIDKINSEKQQAVMGSFTTNELVNAKLPTQFARFLQGQDEATTRANIQDFQNLFNTALNGTVDNKFKQMSHTPQANNNPSQQQNTKEPSKMSYQERMNLFRSNPNEYKRIFG